MEVPRRLSLTLLLVAPLVAAQDMLDVSSSSQGQQVALNENFAEQPALEDPVDWSASAEVVDDSYAWFRGRRSLDNSDELLEIAEQINNRPIFRHRQIVEEREERKRQREELRKKVQRKNSAPAPGSSALASPQRKNSAPVPQSLALAPPQRKYSALAPESSALAPPQRKYSAPVPQSLALAPPQRKYSALAPASPALASPQRRYYGSYSNQFQYPISTSPSGALRVTPINEVYRPQRSIYPYAYYKYY